MKESIIELLKELSAYSINSEIKQTVPLNKLAEKAKKELYEIEKKEVYETFRAFIENPREDFARGFREIVEERDKVEFVKCFGFHDGVKLYLENNWDNFGKLFDILQELIKVQALAESKRETINIIMNCSKGEENNE